jgi:hypothetical protein
LSSATLDLRVNLLKADSYVDLERRVGPDHPLRAIRGLTDSALGALSGDFAALYAALQ